MPTDIVFPDDITLPLRDSVKDLYEESRSKVEMEVGPNRIRRWNRITPRVYELVWDMSAEEFQTFDEWFNFTINGGELPFDVPIQDDSGSVAWITARGVGEYTAECIDGFSWQVSWRVRTVEPIFYVRELGTLRGYGHAGAFGQGNLQVLKPFYASGRAGLLDATGVIITSGLGYNLGNSLGGLA